KLSRNGIAKIDNAFTLRAKKFCAAASVGIGSLNNGGATIRKKRNTKNVVRSTSTIDPHRAGRTVGGCASDSSPKANGTAEDTVARPDDSLRAFEALTLRAFVVIG